MFARVCSALVCLGETFADYPSRSMNSFLSLRYTPGEIS